MQLATLVTDKKNQKEEEERRERMAEQQIPQNLLAT